MPLIESVPLAQLTTLRVGGMPAAMVASPTEQELVDEALVVWSLDEEWMLLGGGSNTVAADEPFEGTVIRVITRGIERLEPAAGVDGAAADGAAEDGAAEDEAAVVRLRVQAGEPWDELVAYTIEQGWAGIEALSGIPGSCGAAPVQNIGAYGQELSDSLVAISFLDYETGEVVRLTAAELTLGYRTSALKQGLRGIVLAIELALTDTAAEASASGIALGQPIRYAQLAGALGVPLGDRVALATVRATVLALRAAKGMVLDDTDTDTWSAGSFFTNPIVSQNFARSLPAALPRWSLAVDLPDRVVPLEDYYGVGPMPGAEVDQGVKLSAAWLIENAGITRGFRLPGSRAAVSSKHTLALTNTGGASAAEIAELARFVQGRVQSEFGVNLFAEPVLVGFALEV